MADVLPRFVIPLLVVDTFAHAGDKTLPEALADMRYRLRQRIDPQKTKLHWKIDLNSRMRLEPRAILNISRSE